MKQYPVGLLGGTFDPIHNGHIKIAKVLMHALPLHCIHFIPNKMPLHRQPPIARAEHRLTMLRIATSQHAKYLTNDLEIKRPGPTYTIDTLTYLHHQAPDQTFCFILGEEVFEKINTWHQWEAILSLAHLIVIKRPDLSLAPINSWKKAYLAKHEIKDPEALKTKPSGFILQQNINPLPISATLIRNKIKNNLPVSDQLLPSGVLEHIQKHRLYLSQP